MKLRRTILGLIRRWRETDNVLWNATGVGFPNEGDGIWYNIDMMKAVLLLSLGTPAEPTAAGLREFYRYFFADPFVFDINPLGRWLLRNLIIKPLRAPKTAQQYAAIWMDEGSPLQVYSEQLQAAMQAAFDEKAKADAETKADEQKGAAADGATARANASENAKADQQVRVCLGMAYSKPFIGEVMAELESSGCREILLLPLFPQYSTATTASAFHAVRQAAKAWREPPQMKFINDLYAEPLFIDAWATLISKHLQPTDGTHLIFSYHGLPESNIRKADTRGCCNFGDCCDAITEANHLCYRAQCFSTTRSIVKALSDSGYALAVDSSAASVSSVPAQQPGYSIAFQSRFGRQAWIQPYLDEHLSALLARGIRRVAVVTPSFVSDCLETIHEIGIEYREQFLKEGGESFTLIPNLNAEPHWHTALSEIATKHLL